MDRIEVACALYQSDYLTINTENVSGTQRLFVECRDDDGESAIYLNVDTASQMRDYLNQWIASQAKATVTQATVDKAAETLADLPQKATTLVDPLSDSIYLTLPDDYARGDYLVVDVGGCDGVIFAAHEDDDQATVRISAASVDMLLTVLGGWKKLYGEAE